MSSEGHHLGDAVHQGQKDDAEGGLHLGVLVEAVQDHVGHGASRLQLDDDPHPVPVRLVPQVADGGDLLLLREGGDLLDEARLVHHEGDLFDHDPVRSVVVFLHHGLGPQDDPAPTCSIRFADSVLRPQT